MHIPRFILITFIALVVGGAMVSTGLLASNSEPRLGDTIVITPVGTPPPAPPPASTVSPSPSPTLAPPPTNSSAPPPPWSTPPAPEGAIVVPGCAPLVGDDDCDDAWDDYYDDFYDD